MEITCGGGLRSVVLASEIGHSSIFGAGSIVKGIYPNNCVIAGNPAKVVKKNVTWSRDNLAVDIQRCGAEYISLTNDLNQHNETEDIEENHE